MKFSQLTVCNLNPFCRPVPKIRKAPRKPKQLRLRNWRRIPLPGFFTALFETVSSPFDLIRSMSLKGVRYELDNLTNSVAYIRRRGIRKSLPSLPYKNRLIRMLTDRLAALSVPPLCRLCVNFDEGQGGCFLKVMLPVRKGSCGRFSSD